MQFVPEDGSPVRNLRLDLRYDGKELHGWQIQQNAVTVQELLQNSLSKIIGSNYEIKGCSRTDTGVHANMYVVSLKTQHKIEPVRLKAALNRFLPVSIAVTGCKEAEPGFHARYSCKRKQYIYKILNREVRDPFLDGYALHYRYPLDLKLLSEAAQHFIGAHDFSSFCTIDRRKEGNLTRTVFESGFEKDGDMVTFTIEADGFLYNMVRIIVGTLLRVAQGKLSPLDIERIIEAKDRREAGPTAPACGLYLNKVIY